MRHFGIGGGGGGELQNRDSTADDVADGRADADGRTRTPAAESNEFTILFNTKAHTYAYYARVGLRYELGL